MGKWHREVWNGLYYAVGDFSDGRRPVRRKLCAVGFTGTDGWSALTIRRLNNPHMGDKWQQVIKDRL